MKMENLLQMGLNRNSRLGQSVYHILQNAAEERSVTVV